MKSLKTNKLLFLLFVFIVLKVFTSEEDKKDASNLYNTNFKTLEQDEQSLLAQKLYYLFQGYDQVFRKKPNKTKITTIVNTIKELNEKIRKTDRALKTFNKVMNKIDKIKRQAKKVKNKKTLVKLLFNFFNYLNNIYEQLYKNLKNKKITIGFDKTKKLPDKLDIPTKQEIENKFNKFYNQNKAKKGIKTSRNIVKTVTNIKPSIIKLKKIDPIKNLQSKTDQTSKVIVLQEKTKPVKETIIPISKGTAFNSNVTSDITASNQTQKNKTTTTDTQISTEYAQTIKQNETESTTNLTKKVDEKFTLCPFLNDLSVPEIPTGDIPTDLDGFNKYVKDFNESVNNLNNFSKNYLEQVNAWKNNSDFKNFYDLLDVIKDKKTNNDNSKTYYDDCVKNAPEGVTSGCSPELLNYIDATNQLYDAYVPVLELLNKYGFSAVPVPIVRKEKVAILPLKTPQALSIDNQDISINTIVGFDGNAFKNKIDEFIKQRIQPCNDQIKKINDSITLLNLTVPDIIYKINEVKNNLQISYPNAQLPFIIELSVSTAVGLKYSPEMVVAQAIIELVGKSSSDEEFFEKLSSQINQNLIDDFSFKDAREATDGFSKVGLGLLGFEKGVLDAVELLIVSQFTFLESIVNVLFDQVDNLIGFDIS